MKEPAVSRRVLMISAGVIWLIGSGFLFGRGYQQLVKGQLQVALIAGAAIAAGALKYRFMLSKVVNLNIVRIRELAPHKDKICILAFQPIQSYLLVILMVALGISLRMLAISPTILGAIYFAIGTALVLGALRYFREARQFR